MDGVIKYLPSPLEKEPVKTEDPELGITLLRRPDKKDKFCALAFKVLCVISTVYETIALCCYLGHQRRDERKIGLCKSL